MMVETRTVVFCATCTVFWGVDDEAGCVDAELDAVAGGSDERNATQHRR
jgi:hypothetical protein